MSTTDHNGLEAIAAAIYKDHAASKMMPYMLGLFFTSTLQPIATLQFIQFCRKSWSRNGWPIRILAIWMITTGLGFYVTQCARCLDVYVFGFGRYVSFLDQRKPCALVAFMEFAHFGSEAFYIHRAYLLADRGKWVLITIGIPWLGLVGMSIYATANFPKLNTEWTKLELDLFSAQGCLIAIIDTSLTCFIIWQLYRRRAETEVGRTLIDRLILLSAETQLPVSIFAIMLAVANGMGWIFLSPIGLALICTLSQMTLFAVLNSRRRIRKRLGLTLEEGLSMTPPVVNGVLVVPNANYSLSSVMLETGVATLESSGTSSSTEKLHDRKGDMKEGDIEEAQLPVMAKDQ